MILQIFINSFDVLLKWCMFRMSTVKKKHNNFLYTLASEFHFLLFSSAFLIALVGGPCHFTSFHTNNMKVGKLFFIIIEYLSSILVSTILYLLFLAQMIYNLECSYSCHLKNSCQIS